MPLTTQLAFLRAVNVGGTGAIAMADLRAWLAELGFVNPRTLLASGNAVFQTKGASGEKLEKLLETGAAKKFGLSTSFFVRPPDEWAEAIAHNPFSEHAKTNPSRLMVVVLKSAPAPAQVAALQAAIKGDEQIAAHGRHAYITYPAGIADSKLTLPLIEKHLGTRGTARNWNTVQKMAALAV